MTSRFDRFFNPKDGTYANVPIIPMNVEKFRGKRPFNTSVLIGNWYEDRSKFKEQKHRAKGSYLIEYPSHPGAVPDLVLRRQLLLSQEERPARQILDHHDIDDRKQMISSYDEQYHRRGAYGQHQEKPERKWRILEKTWIPEQSDHPLQDEPTSWGLVEYKRSQSQCLQRERTMPSLSEYTSRYVPQRPEPRRLDIPRIYSTAISRTHSLNENYQSPFTSRRDVTMHDTTSMDHVNSLRRNSYVPRSFFFLGKVPDSLDDRAQDKLPQLTASVNTNPPVTSSSFDQHANPESTD